MFHPDKELIERYYLISLFWLYFFYDECIISFFWFIVKMILLKFEWIRRLQIKKHAIIVCISFILQFFLEIQFCTLGYLLQSLDICLIFSAKQNFFNSEKSFNKYQTQPAMKSKFSSYALCVFKFNHTVLGKWISPSLSSAPFAGFAVILWRR